MAAAAASVAVAAAQRVAVVHSTTAAERLQQRGCCGGRSAAVVRSTTVGGCSISGATKARQWRTAAWWEQRGGCGGFTGTVRKWTNASAFERHQLADVRVFVLGRGWRDDSVDSIIFVATTAAPVATSTAVADVPPLPTTTPMATPTTLFVKLNLI